MCESLDAYLEAAELNVQEDFGLSYAEVDGVNYAIPVTDCADFVWVNLDMLEEKGIKIPENWTFEDYKAIAKRLTTGEGEDKVYGHMCQVAWPDMWMKPAYVALGSEIASEKYVFDLDNPYFERALQWRYDMEVTDQSAVPVTLQKTSNLAMQDMFLQGKVGMLYGGSWLIRYAKDTENYPHDFKTGFVQLPKWDDTDNYYNSASSLDEYLAINSKSENKEAAWEVIKYWATEGYYPMCAGGKIPSWKGADQDQVIANLLGDGAEEIFDVESVIDVMFADHNYFLSPVTETRGEIASALEIEADKCLSGDQTVQEAIANMKERAESINS